MILIPMMVAPLVIGLLFNFFINPKLGLYVWLVNTLHLPLPTVLTADSVTAMIVVIIMDVWEWAPYLGLVFLLAAAAVLALQQLSQAADNTSRYTILRRLGAEEKMVARSATQQVALAFLIPLALALIHSTVGMKAANDIIAAVGKVDTVHSTAVTTLMLLLVYGGYFFATSLACRRMACKRG